MVQSLTGCLHRWPEAVVIVENVVDHSRHKHKDSQGVAQHCYQPREHFSRRVKCRVYVERQHHSAGGAVVSIKQNTTVVVALEDRDNVAGSLVQLQASYADGRV